MKYILLFFLIISTAVGFSQRKNDITSDYSHFQLLLKKDTIDFVITETNFTEKKPILLFCQGSLPVPLFLKLSDDPLFPVTLNNFDVAAMKKHYHVVVISMPNTPVVVGQENLNSSYSYVLDKSQENSYSPAYLKADYVDNYLVRAQHVLKFLRKQKWVDPNKLVVAGHSQGAKIALDLAHNNKTVTQLGLFGFNPLGRIDFAFRQLRKQAETGEITWEEADSIQNEVLVDYASFFDPSNSLSFEKTIVSFSQSQLEKIKSLTVPTYIAYGSADINADFCDLLPLYFIENGKTNYQLHRYPNLEHNFFPINKAGQIDYENGKWQAVMNDFISWTTR